MTWFFVWSNLSPDLIILKRQLEWFFLWGLWWSWRVWTVRPKLRGTHHWSLQGCKPCRTDLTHIRFYLAHLDILILSHRFIVWWLYIIIIFFIIWDAQIIIHSLYTLSYNIVKIFSIFICGRRSKIELHKSLYFIFYD